VLVVEDDVIREQPRPYLDLAGFASEEAKNGQRRSSGRARMPSYLVLLGVMLPTLDGVNVCRAIREAGATSVAAASQDR
jgi:DNA-binding response OmpR family regulator